MFRLICLAASLLVTFPLLGQESAEPVPADPRRISLQVTILDIVTEESLDDLSKLTPLELDARIAQYDKQKLIIERTLSRLTTLENSPATLQFGQAGRGNPPIVNPAFGRGNRAFREFGTLIKVTNRIDQQGRILADLLLERSWPGEIVAATPASDEVPVRKSEGELQPRSARSTPLETYMLSVTTSLALQPGISEIVGGSQWSSETASFLTPVIVRAELPK